MISRLKLTERHRAAQSYRALMNGVGVTLDKHESSSDAMQA